MAECFNSPDNTSSTTLCVVLIREELPLPNKSDSTALKSGVSTDKED
ncbi:TPA: hypothetical protein WI150_000189 [Neisseria meningitidis]|nr:hypothetical protein [Neisseria meningitidis]